MAVEELEAELGEETVEVRGLEVVSLLVAEDDEAAAALDKLREGGDVRRGDVVRRGVGAGGLVAGIGDEHGVHSGKRLGVQRLGMDADLELAAQAGEHFLVVAVGLVARLAQGVEVTAVEQHGLLRRLGGGE